MARDSKGITQFYLQPTHEPYLPLLPSRRASPPFGWYSLHLPMEGWLGWVDLSDWLYTEIDLPAPGVEPQTRSPIPVLTGPGVDQRANHCTKPWDAVCSSVIFSSLVSAIKPRVSSWSSEQCVGDVLVRFSTSLRKFVTYLQSYAALLVNVERCAQQFPAFRTFVRRRERTADTKMLTYERALSPMKLSMFYQTILPFSNSQTDHPRVCI